MKRMEVLRILARRLRAIALPIGTVSGHLAAMTRRTARDLGFDAHVIQNLEAATQETCREVAFSDAQPKPRTLNQAR